MPLYCAQKFSKTLDIEKWQPQRDFPSAIGPETRPPPSAFKAFQRFAAVASSTRTALFPRSAQVSGGWQHSVWHRQQTCQVTAVHFSPLFPPKNGRVPKQPGAPFEELISSSLGWSHSAALEGGSAIRSIKSVHQLGANSTRTRPRRATSDPTP